MVRKEIIIIADYTQQSSVTLDELCEICLITADYVYDLMEHNIVAPRSDNPEEWVFDVEEINRIQRALRLEHDLEVNMQGVALILDLLDEMEEMRTHIRLLEKHFSKF